MSVASEPRHVANVLQLIRDAPETTPLNRETPSAGETVFQTIIDDFGQQLAGAAFSPSLIQFIWVANRCVQLVAQNISAMPLKFSSPFPNSREPAWLSSPDPAWYPNGIGDAIFSAVDAYYRYGDAFLYITADYADSYPAGFTVLDSAAVTVQLDQKLGRRKFDLAGLELDAARVVQISRDPRGKLRGTSALRSYADIVTGSARVTRAAADAIVNTPLSVIESQKKISADQAAAVQSQWVTSGRARPPGAPAIIPPDLKLAAGAGKLGFSPEELMLVEVQEFDARVLASSCGVPPFLLNIALTGGLTYQNPAMLGEYWWRTELYATCSRISRALTAQMLPRGNSVWFDPAHLIDPLSAQQAQDESPAVNASPQTAPSTGGATVIPIQEAIA